MKVLQFWLFTFTQPDRDFITARVAANDRQEACSIMGHILGRSLIAADFQHPEPGTILIMFGMIKAEGASLISAIMADGSEAMPA